MADSRRIPMLMETLPSKRLQTPVLTPAALQCRSMPWALETPSPSPKANQMPHDPFHLRRVGEATSPRARLQADCCIPTLAEVLTTSNSTNSTEAVTNNQGQEQDQGLPLSRDQIRSICLPFFEQMVDAVQDAMLRQQQASVCSQSESTAAPSEGLLGEPSSQMQDKAYVPQNRRRESAASTSVGVHFEAGEQDLIEDDAEDNSTKPPSPAGSTEVSPQKLKLFSGLGLSDDIDVEASPARARAMTPASATAGSPAAAEAPKARSTTIVCCHWKNKGWCRYQEQCKFAHPDHKRGVGPTRRSYASSSAAASVAASAAPTSPSPLSPSGAESGVSAAAVAAATLYNMHLGQNMSPLSPSLAYQQQQQQQLLSPSRYQSTPLLPPAHWPGTPQASPLSAFSPVRMG
eukprot:CAMPEP_0206469888 /NCGR_PEP_ID=MMETSP0324_2-20121206/30573_1 /ASSEMBLY_ACC=CAM_ASM_000836 /TAXON_ID=2866 /ORGANISM="Crypthecodinium cohnii, Strain Seligo" /LENGTH=403 /DNA_ID=CAMNT_0053943783 /DNA_START=131 /DNA_END=1338 /DNA_ORIENTATION=-